MTLSKKRNASRAKKRTVSRAKKVRLAIECTPLERRQMKTLAASEDKTLNEFVLESVRMRFKRCKRSHTPNAETAKALGEVEKGEGLIEYESIEAFFKSLAK
ncbi:MAG: hypothetical protein V4487_01445 [Chlamydiota bacterium]